MPLACARELGTEGAPIAPPRESFPLLNEFGVPYNATAWTSLPSR